MKKIGLVTEEAADLPKETIEKYQIGIVPVKMDWPDIENLPGKNTFQKMREAEKRGIKSFGKTSQPSPKDFIDTFKKQLERFEKVLCITLTSKLSGSYNSAIQARNFLASKDQKRIFIIDSLSASAGEGLLVLQAIDLIKENKKIEEIVKKLKEFISKIHFLAIIEDPKWAEAGGRIPHFLANWLRKMAKIGVRPLVKVKNGVVTSGGIIIGAKDISNALFKKFKKETKKLIKEGKKIRTVIVHGDDLKGAQRLREMIERECKNVEVAFLNLMDDVLGILAGPNAMLLAWCEKSLK